MTDVSERDVGVLAEVCGGADDSPALTIRVIGMHYTPEKTGNAPYTTGMAEALRRAGHTVDVVTGYPHYPQWSVAPGYDGLRRHETINGVPVTRVRHPVPGTPTARARIAMDATFAAHAAMIGGRRPDVVIAVSPVLLTVASAALRWKRSGTTALGVVTQDLYGRALVETGVASGRTARLGAALERTLLRQADGVVAVHDTFARSLEDLGVDPARVTVIRNWSHTTISRADREATRRELGWRPDEVIALHAGNMGAKQGLENVVRAARVADERGDPIRFVLLGDGNRRRALEEEARGVERCTFLDPLPDGRFEAALAAADVLVLNEAETVVEMSVPSKLTSYFAAGRPVVAASHRRSAASAEIQRSGAGVVVPPGAPQRLLESALDTARSGRAEAFGENGQAYAREILDDGAAARAYCEWVQRLAAARSRR